MYKRSAVMCRGVRSSESGRRELVFWCFEPPFRRNYRVAAAVPSLLSRECFDVLERRDGRDFQ
jgi:hypothetical protein